MTSAWVLAASVSVSATLLVVFCAEVISWTGVPAVGTAALGAAGVLASQGTLSLWAVLVAGVAGAEIGGIAGWSIGRRLATRPAKRPHEGRMAQRGRKALEAGHELEEKVGGVMVLFVSSWVSGSLGMPLRRFAIWNLIAATLWTAVSVLGAYGIGNAIDGGNLKQVLTPLVIAAAALALLAYGFRHWRRHRGAPVAVEGP